MPYCVLCSLGPVYADFLCPMHAMTFGLADYFDMFLGLVAYAHTAGVAACFTAASAAVADQLSHAVVCATAHCTCLQPRLHAPPNPSHAQSKHHYNATVQCTRRVRLKQLNIQLCFSFDLCYMQTLHITYYFVSLIISHFNFDCFIIYCNIHHFIFALFCCYRHRVRDTERQLASLQTALAQQQEHHDRQSAQISKEADAKVECIKALQEDLSELQRQLAAQRYSFEAALLMSRLALSRSCFPCCC